MASVESTQFRLVSSNLSADVYSPQGLEKWDESRGAVQIQNIKEVHPDILAVQECSAKAFEDLKAALSFEGMPVLANIHSDQTGQPASSEEGTTLLWNPQRYEEVRTLDSTYCGFNSKGQLVVRPNKIVELRDKRTQKVVAVASTQLMDEENDLFRGLQMDQLVQSMSHSQADTHIIAGDLRKQTEQQAAKMQMLGYKLSVNGSEKRNFVYVKGLGSETMTNQAVTQFDPKGSLHKPIVTLMDQMNQPPQQTPATSVPEMMPRVLPQGQQTAVQEQQTSTEVSPQSGSQVAENPLEMIQKEVKRLEEKYPKDSMGKRILERRQLIVSQYPKENQQFIECIILDVLSTASEGPEFGFEGRFLGFVLHHPQLPQELDRKKLHKQMLALADHATYSDTDLGIKKAIPLVTQGACLLLGWQYGLGLVGTAYALDKVTNTNRFSFKEALNTLPGLAGSYVGSISNGYLGFAATLGGIVVNGVLQNVL